MGAGFVLRQKLEEGSFRKVNLYIGNPTTSHALQGKLQAARKRCAEIPNHSGASMGSCASCRLSHKRATGLAPTVSSLLRK